MSITALIVKWHRGYELLVEIYWHDISLPRAVITQRADHAQLHLLLAGPSVLYEVGIVPDLPEYHSE